MIDRYFITLGAPVAAAGDTCWCPTCLSEGVIRSDGPRLSDTIAGRQVALQDDLCICKCSPPPRLLASQTFICQSIDGDWFAGQAAAANTAAAQANEAGLAPPGKEDLALLLVDPDTQEAIADLAYQLDLASTQVESTLDHKGWTDPLSEAEQASSVTMQPGTADA